MRTSFIDTPKGPIFARHWGDESLPRLLLLHGFPEYSGAWEELAQRLKHKFHCIAPDQRGYGQTGGPDDVSAYTTSSLVKDMLHVIDDKPITVLGHDWGAAVAYGLAMSKPDLVQKLIIANGVHPAPFQREMASGGPQSVASQYILSLRRAGSEDHYAQDNYARLQTLFSAKMDFDWFCGEKRAQYLTEWSRPGRLKTMIHWYRASPLKVAVPGEPITDLPELPKDRLMIRCPHLLIWGAGDTALLPESTKGLEEYAPILTRITIPEADHWLAHQKPDEMATAILNWVEDAKSA
ncbi:MAG: alpha/beta hydrolase [Aliishimia sp.]